MSADASYRPEVHKMGEWLAKELEALGVTYNFSFQLNIVLRNVNLENMKCKALNWNCRPSSWAAMARILKRRLS